MATDDPRDKNQRECGYCGGTDLVYELSRMRGDSANRCIRCLAIGQGQQKLSLPYDSYDDDGDRRDDWNYARDWFQILARLVDDEPVLKRDEDAVGTVNDQIREFLANIMGSDAYHAPSEVSDDE